jgi:hypothetical protein
MTKLKSKIHSTLSLLFPNNKAEYLLFGLFVLIYGSLGSTIALKYRIIFDDRIPWDAYFSFDNRAIIMTGGGFERHPLSIYFFDFLRNFALFVSGGEKNEIFRLVWAWLSTITISLTLVQIYKYLTNITLISKKSAWLLTVFFAFFSTNILLSFTPETYTYSLFLLTFFNYYAARKIQQKQSISFFPLMLSGVAIGGLTITNIVKTYIPILFEKRLFLSWKKFWQATLKAALSAGVFVLLFLMRMDFNLKQILTKTDEQYEKFSNSKSVPFWDMVTSWFLGGNILFPGFIIKNYNNKKGFEYKALFMDVYKSNWPYLFVGILLILVIWSIIKNFKNTYFQILTLSFLVDIIIHCVLKFGLNVSYIYGGHFVFVYPLFLGWLFHSYQKQPKILNFLVFVVLVLCVYLAANNIYRMNDFFIFLETYYK